MFVTRSFYRVATHTRFMGRQQTLGKFFEMPKSSKAAPPQQSNLSEMWGGKKRKPNTNEESVQEEVIVNGKADELKTGASLKSEISENLGPPSKLWTSPGPSKSKRRRVVESDDEDSTTTPPTLIGLNGHSSPQPSSKSREKAKAVSQPEPSSKSKGKAKAVPQPEPAEKQLAESPASADEAEDENPDESEPEDDDEDAATQTAEEALSRVAEVDIKGGWKIGDSVPYAALTKTFSLIEATTKRLEKTALLTSFFLLVIQRSKNDDSNSLLQCVYLCINRLSPDYVGVELGIGESLLIKAISESTGRSLATVKADLKKEGDLGLVAMNSKNSQKTLFKPKPLTVPFVFSNLREIALSSGHSSQAKKVSIITKLLAACQDFEAKYIVRSLEGKLRIGNAERTVLVALAHAVVLAKEHAGKRWSKEKLASRLEEGASIIKSVYSELPTYELVIPALFTHGLSGLRTHCKLTPGVPLKPMLAKPTKAIGEVLDRFEGRRFTCEYKYDGERAQVHRLEDGSVSVFSRNSEDMKAKYPDLVEQLPRCIMEKTTSFVLDAEAVAIDKTSGRLMPFQELSKRKRKDVKVEDIQVKVCLFAFDLIYLNGEPLLQKSLSERRELLREHFQIVPGEFDFAKSSDGSTTDEIQAFLEESVKDGCEGLMVKMLESDASYYEPSRRSVNWLKLKKDYLAGVGDSLDLVVVGGYYGKGKRTNVYGAFLLACFDTDAEEYQTICKIGTGFSEEMLQTHWDTLRPLEITKPRGDIKPGGAKPDVWFEPKIVWEVLAADLSLSPIYTAAQGLAEERGISLRFPRFIRIRDDKSADDATGPEQISEMYERQVLAQSKGGKKSKGDGDDGFW
ncbi:ATP-dependent DNA ligase [Suillus bovinus]|uniref:ATP-dependent DNA ligase n=1 Tax=Suillus bovinus TaxID=48563 RepID=UPI001B85B94B|nr:ATP-dependent DNA ligase [Suillus bovinus]KAG2159844.1 ATP-dependent DNA ligase [Suillus bovinus]